MTTSATHKRCTKCGHELPRAMFHKKTEAKDGLNPHCRVCVSRARRKPAPLGTYEAVTIRQTVEDRTADVQVVREVDLTDFGYDDLENLDMLIRHGMELLQDVRMRVVAKLVELDQLAETAGRSDADDAFLAEYGIALDDPDAASGKDGGHE